MRYTGHGKNAGSQLLAVYWGVRVFGFVGWNHLRNINDSRWMCFIKHLNKTSWEVYLFCISDMSRISRKGGHTDWYLFEKNHVDLHGLMHKLGQFDHDASFPWYSLVFLSWGHSFWSLGALMWLEFSEKNIGESCRERLRERRRGCSKHLWESGIFIWLLKAGKITTKKEQSKQYPGHREGQKLLEFPAATWGWVLGRVFRMLFIASLSRQN